MPLEIFRNNLKDIRQRKGMTQEKMAALINVPRHRYAAWEEGRSFPRIDLFVHLCTKLGIPDLAAFVTKISGKERKRKPKSALELKYSVLSREKKEVVDLILNS